MRSTGSWIILEKSGRWAAALRMALARHPETRGAHTLPKRIYEVRSLVELNAAIREQRPLLVLAEVRLDNLAAILELLAHARQPNVPIVALIDDSLATSSRTERCEMPSALVAAAALREAGALSVLETPRQISSLFDFVERQMARRESVFSSTTGHKSLTDWAWAALPWQDD
jgi:hypothetical protein